ncbi:putative membrane protein YphA (DoxX/SURF4 family) [Spinactinospora alkalitolerans]|uniref:Putative membrane protein YphA (DoxX/SURF4 family) n=1 Tax=Spinactinospora alkalitolerans TaxID=687207 RepID=A0A852TP99_9ACTN|nr:DoxX family membrane protein [Spinactinospora alkalitolerans]NYE45778.1 putative membrane protein YphA (DoxX/SURF4 family) [Spinactinospora alkalitolerans]
MLAVPFLVDGVENLRDPAPRAKELAPTVHRLAQRYSWLPDDPELVVRVQGAAGVAGGTMLVLGKAGRLSCLVLAAQSVPTLMAEVRAFRSGDPEERTRVQSVAVRDVSLLGALLLAATEPKRRPPRLVYDAEHAVRSARRSSAKARRQAGKKMHRLAS